MKKSLASWAHYESTRACVFCVAMLAFQVTAHPASVSAACCALALAIGRELPVLSVAVSSAYMKTDVPGTSLSSAARSADQSVKRVGARTLPWGRPARRIRYSSRPCTLAGIAGEASASACDGRSCRTPWRSRTTAGRTSRRCVLPPGGLWAWACSSRLAPAV